MEHLTLEEYAENYLLPFDYLSSLGCRTQTKNGVIIPYYIKRNEDTIAEKVIRYNDQYWIFAGHTWKETPIEIVYGEWKLPDYWPTDIILANSEPETQILWYAGFQAVYFPSMITLGKLYRFKLDAFKKIYFYRRLEEFKTIAKSSFKKQVRYMPPVQKIDKLIYDLGESLTEFTSYIRGAMQSAWSIEEIEQLNTEEKKQ